MRRSTSHARVPPALPGLDPVWSRLVCALDGDRIERTWHVLDSRPERGSGGSGLSRDPDDVSSLGTLLCVHGNPTWSYLWRRLVAAPPPGWRVVAVDQLGMGFSQRPDAARTLAQRIDDLSRLSEALGITGRVVTVAHDWGGPISLGWGLAHREQLAGIVLTNTAVHQPVGSPAPALIKLARAPGLRQLICQWTPAFVATAAALSGTTSRRSRLPRSVRRALAAPYRRPGRRRAIAEFVADIPLERSHPSAPALAGVLAGLPGLQDVPALLLWGPRDPVFSDRYLNDLHERLPQADVHRFAGASHLVTEDRPEIAGLIAAWVAALPDPPTAIEPVAPGSPCGVAAPTGARAERPALWAALSNRSGDRSPAVVEPGRAPVSFADLDARVSAVAAGLRDLGLRPGQRVALLVPPGIELTTVVYACWQAGAAIVVADAGLGVRRLGDALRSAGVDFVIGSAKGLAAARLWHLSGRRILAGPTGWLADRLAEITLDELTHAGRGHPAPAPSGVADECAVVFTSGATGAPKGVVYRVGQVQAQIELIAATYRLSSADRLVAAFAPFALYGPALGIASCVPAMDVTSPATLTAAALAEAITAVDATVVFAAPAALRNVVATSAQLTAAQRGALARPRLVMSAGAPLPVALLREVATLLPGAAVHTPYGMTEALPVTDIDLAQIERAGNGAGVCVGRPVAGTQLGISALDTDGTAPMPPRNLVHIPGEVCVRAPHVKDRYDRLWATEAASSRDQGWHRTGDVGHLDDEGRLWIEGRLGDVVTTEHGPVTPVPVEQRIENCVGVARAAVVGVGPVGIQQLIAIVATSGQSTRPPRRPPKLTLASIGLSEQVRASAACDLAAVFTTPGLPVDIRHNSKIDHPALAVAAARLLAGRRR